MASKLIVTLAIILDFFRHKLFISHYLSPVVYEAPVVPTILFLYTLYLLFSDTIIYPKGFKRIHPLLIKIVEVSRRM